MREEIIRSLERARSHRDQWRLWQQQHAQSTSVGQSSDFPPAHHPLTQERNKKLDQMMAHFEQLKACIEQMLGSSSVHIGTSTSLEIDTDSSMHNQVVIELTVEGSLAAVFVYGSVSNDILHRIHQCIQVSGLIQLSHDEIHELEQSGSYHELF